MTTPALRPHHDGSPLYVSHPAPVLGDEVDVRIRIPDGYGPVIRVLVRSNPAHEPAWVDELPPTSRGEGGFGSTGTR